MGTNFVRTRLEASTLYWNCAENRLLTVSTRVFVVVFDLKKPIFVFFSRVVVVLLLLCSKLASTCMLTETLISRSVSTNW